MNPPISRRPSQCSECGCFGHHSIGCPEGERLWEVAQMRAQEEAEEDAQTEESEADPPADPIAEVMAHFVEIYGKHSPETITIR
jgi:hypothetical protein